MAEFLIDDRDLIGLAGKVVIITGSSSGIGLGTVNVLTSLGAKVVGGDVQPFPKSVQLPNFTHQRTDVSSWQDLVALFKTAKEIHGHIDHVFCNAGIGPVANYFPSPGKAEDHDADGNPLEPARRVYDINLTGAVNTATLAIYHMRQQQTEGSVVINASCAGVHGFRAIDYAATKHGVIGFMRSMRNQLTHSKLPIRINALAPSWTNTGVSPVALEQIGTLLQTTEAVGRAAACLMADPKRHGDLIYVAGGKYQEIDNAVLLPAYGGILSRMGKDGSVTEDDDYQATLDLSGGLYKVNK